jgi:murein DD-endopeptidase MepM/ murein hydrolase activator NlpD
MNHLKVVKLVSSWRIPMALFLLLLLCVSMAFWEDMGALAATRARKSRISEKKSSTNNKKKPKAITKKPSAPARTSKPSEADLLRERQQVRREMEAMRQKLNSAKKRVNARRAQIDAVTAKLRQKERTLARIEAQLASLGEQHQRVQEKKDATEEQLAAERRRLADRIRRNYERGDVSYLHTLLQPQSLIDPISHSYYVEQIVNRDARQVHETKADVYMLAEKERYLGARITAQRVVHTNQRIQIARNRADLAFQHRALDKAQADLRSIEEDLTQMAAEYERIAKQIQAAQRAMGNAGDLRACDGAFILPVESRISSGFGMRRDPFNPRRERMHKGIDIAKSYGSAIYAACEGRVIIVDRSPSYGRYVVLAHGGGFSTLYAHCSEILVGKGEPVKKGQPIARVGQTGRTTGPHLHFEVQHNSKQIDPMPLLSHATADRLVESSIGSERD